MFNFWRRKNTSRNSLKDAAHGSAMMTHELQPADTTRTLLVPRHLLSQTHAALLPYWQKQVEMAILWAGTSSAELDVATTLVLPSLHQTSGNYQVKRASLRQMAKLLASQKLTVLAQVHTHPENWVGHSAYDDAHAYSTAEGALSLVWPDYGRTLPNDLCGIGVHEVINGSWVSLDDRKAASQRVRLVDSVVDLRWTVESGVICDDE